MKNKKDIIFYSIILGIIPLILILIYLLPKNYTNIFIFNFNHPTIISIFFSNYTHQNLGHLCGDLLIYFITMISLLFVETNKKRLYAFSIFAFFIYPFFLPQIIEFLFSLFKIPLSLINNSLGFSGIILLFEGYFLYYLLCYFYKDFKINRFRIFRGEYILKSIILLALAGLLFYSFFPERLITSAGKINTPVHFVSFTLGFLFPYFYRLIKRINK